MKLLDTMEERFDREFALPGDVSLTVPKGGMYEHDTGRVKQFIRAELALREQEIVGEIEKLSKAKLDGEGLPFENSPEIYGNQRIEAYRKGWNESIAKVLATITKPKS